MTVHHVNRNLTPHTTILTLSRRRMLNNLTIPTPAATGRRHRQNEDIVDTITRVKVIVMPRLKVRAITVTIMATTMATRSLRLQPRVIAIVTAIATVRVIATATVTVTQKAKVKLVLLRS